MNSRACINSVVILSLVSCLFVRPAQADVLTLEEAVERGLHGHPLLLSAAGELKIAGGSFTQNVLPPDPVVQFQNEEIPEHSKLSEYSLQTLGITQSMEFPLVTYYRAKAGRHDVSRARAAYKLAESKARAEITTAYVDFWLDQRLFAVSESLSAAASRLADVAERRFSAGEATVIETGRLYSQAARISLERDRARLEMEVSAEKLCRIVDLPVVSVVEPVMPEALAPVGSGPPDGSAFLRQVERTLQSLRAQETAAKLSWLPDIEIGIFRQKDDLARRYWGGSVALSFPFWSAFGAGGSVTRASGEFEVESSRVEYDLRSWNVRWDEVTRGHELSRKEVQYYEAAVLPSARRTYSALTVAFDAGELDAGDIIAGFVEAKSVEREYLEAVRRLWEWNTDLGVLLCSADS